MRPVEEPAKAVAVPATVGGEPSLQHTTGDPGRWGEGGDPRVRRPAVARHLPASRGISRGGSSVSVTGKATQHRNGGTENARDVHPGSGPNVLPSSAWPSSSGGPCPGELSSPPSRIRLPVVSVARRMEIPMDQVAGLVTVIGREEIERRQLRTLPELLRTVPGMHVVQAGGQGKQTSVFTHGTESDHTLVLLDGIEISDPSTPGNVFDIAHLLLSDVERVEVLRGPVSTLYGSEAVGGVINVVLRKGSASPAISAWGEAGGHSTQQYALGLRGGSPLSTTRSATRAFTLEEPRPGRKTTLGRQLSVASSAAVVEAKTTGMTTAQRPCGSAFTRLTCSTSTSSGASSTRTTRSIRSARISTPVARRGSSSCAARASWSCWRDSGSRPSGSRIRTTTARTMTIRSARPHTTTQAGAGLET